MVESNFGFLRSGWPELFELSRRAEVSVRSDPRAACFYSRLTLESLVNWLFDVDDSLKWPYESSLSALLYEPTFKNLVPKPVFHKAQQVRVLGNKAAHEGRKPSVPDALMAVKDLFHITYWVAANYSTGERPDPGLRFDEGLVPSVKLVGAESLAALQAQAERARQRQAELVAAREENEALAAELEQLKSVVAAAKAVAAGSVDEHDYNEAETRDYFIDLLLGEAGWDLDPGRDFEVKVEMPGGGTGYVDYVLWGGDGKPLGLVEAKRARKTLEAGKQQAKLYADALEAQHGQRPIIFVSNGYEHLIWDDTFYPPREVQGFYRKSELELLIQRRTTRRELAVTPVNEEIAGRPYQQRAIRRITETFEGEHQRRALLVMATGAGKTRTVIGLADVLLRANWAKRVLFLADRTALVRQAANAFKQHLPQVSPVNLVTEKHGEGRVYLSTYQTMMGLLEEPDAARRRFGVGYFDLVVIDEAHRSVFRKYLAILKYFDAMLVGLTATPKDEVIHSTYRLFGLESGVPTDSYSLDDAVGDGYLVPPRARSVALRFQREGIRYADLSEDEKDQWDALEWDEEHPGQAPDEVGAAAINKWLFNADTVDKVLADLMTHGHKVSGGDKLAKTIIFAKNQAHAEFIAERFDRAYPHLAGKFARVITHSVNYAATLIDDFSDPGKLPQIAISVDMLDTGIDVPDVANLVFFKVVRSRTKFWQMIGRGTRLRPGLYGPGRDKTDFLVFDYCGNFEFFGEHPDFETGGAGMSLTERLFRTRLELLGALDERIGEQVDVVRVPQPDDDPGQGSEDPVTLPQLRAEVAGTLQQRVAAMNVGNVIVRPKRRLVEQYADPEAWDRLGETERVELAEQLAPLPAEEDPEHENTRRFDVLLLRLQLALLEADPGYEVLRDRVVAIGSALEEKDTIPMVRAQLPLIQDIQSEDWWQDTNVAELERVRRRLRGLVVFIDSTSRNLIYTDFEDQITSHGEVQLGQWDTSDPGLATAQFRAKARDFLAANEDHVTIQKLRRARPLTESDLAELERILAENGIGGPDQIEAAADEVGGLGLFIRSLVGLDRAAAKDALAGFLDGSTMTANQIEFINLIIDHLTQRGVMTPGLLYEAPFTALAPHGPDDLFNNEQVEQIISILDQVRRSAVAA